MSHTSTRELSIAIGRTTLQGVLRIPADSTGIVLFAHGSGSSRLSRRNQHVARTLRSAGLGTLLLDLLTAQEDHEDKLTGRYRFDVGRLAQRLLLATQWADHLGPLPIGYFGASTGAAAALIAAADGPARLRAIVSRGGRPDLARPDNLARVHVPTLLVVGEHDPAVIEVNLEAMKHLGGARRLAVVPGASHLFEEMGALDAVGRLASDWFVKHFQPAEAQREGRQP